MAQYVLQSIKLKNHKVGSKELSKSGKSWVKAQYDTQYQVIDEQTGLPPKKLRLRKKDKNLIVENDGEILITVRGFYADTHAEIPARYLVDADCVVEDGFRPDRGNAGSRYVDIVGGVGKDAASSNASGYVWSWESGVCAFDLGSQISSQPGNDIALADTIQSPEVSHAQPNIQADESLSRTQMMGIGLGAIVLGAAAGGGGGGGGGGSNIPSNVGANSSNNSVPRSAPQGGIDPSSDSGILGDGITSDTTPTISGLGAIPGDLITVVIPGTGEVLTVVVSSNGSWSVTPTQAIPDGTQGSIVITATDPSGHVSAQTLVPLTIITDLVVQGTVTGGPMYAGIGLEARDSQGNLLASSSINADGTYNMKVDRSGSYRGAIMVTAVDNNATAGNYLDEVTGVNKSLGVNLRGLGVADSGSAGFNILGNGNTQLTVNISILSELATRQVLGTNSWPTPVTTSQIITANKSIANAFGIGSNIDITTVVPMATNAPGFSGADGLSNAERVGLVLAKLSGLDALNGGNVATTLDQLTGTVTNGGVLNDTGARLVDQGRAQALLALKANATTFSSGSGDADTNTVLNRQLLGEAIITGQSVVSGGKLFVSGTALPFSTVVITLPDGTLQSAIADSSGVFTLTSVNVQPDLTQPLEVRSQDGLAQPVVYDPPAAPLITANNGRLISGSGSPGSEVTVKLLDGTIIGTAIVDDLGNWSMVPDAAISTTLRTSSPLPTLTASAIDTNGNVSGPGQKQVDLNGLATRIVEASDGYINAAEKVSGSPSGSDLTIYLPGNAVANDVVTTTITRPDGTTFTLTHTLSAAEVTAGIITQTMHATDLSLDGLCRASTTISHGGTVGATVDQRFVLDTVAPAAPVIALSNGAVINGTAEPGSTITVMDGSIVVGIVGPVGADGNWTLVPAAPLTNASTLTATAKDAAGNSSAVASGVVDMAALIITGIVDDVGPNIGLMFDGAVTNDSSPKLSGTLGTPLAAGEVLQIYRKLDSGSYVSIGTPTINGVSWNLQDTGLADGAYTYQSRITNGASVVQSSAEFNLNVQTVAPTSPTTTISETSDQLINAVEKATDGGVPVVTLLPNLARVGDVVSTVVTLSDNSTYTMRTTLTLVDIQAGQISQLLPQVKLGIDGSYSASTTYTSSLTGLTSAPSVNSFTLATVPTAPSAITVTPSGGTVVANTLNGTTTAMTFDATIVAGQAAGGKAEFYVNGVLVGTDTDIGATNTSVSYTTNDGSPTTAEVQAAIMSGGVVTVKLYDAAGNSITGSGPTLIRDVTPPAAPVINTMTDNVGAVVGTVASGGISDDNTPFLAGTAEVNSVVHIYDGSTLLGTVTADGTGHWSFSPSTLSDGAHTFTATATDAVGNVSAASSAVALTIDTLAPAALSMTLATDSGSSGTDQITNVGTVNITGLEAGATWQYSVNGGSSWTIGSGSSFMLSNGVYANNAVQVRQVDVAGNVSNLASASYTIDTVLTAPFINTSNGQGSVTGTGEAGSTVTLLDNSNQIIGTALVGPSGSWSVVLSNTLADGVIIKARLEDVAGNISSDTSSTVNVNIPIVNPTNGDVIAGTGKPGDYIKVSYVLSGNTIMLGPVQVDSSGNWSVTPGGGQVPPNNTIVTAIDIGTNSASITSFGQSTNIVDRYAAPPPNADVAASSDSGSSNTDNITSDTTPTITGTSATPGDTITLYAPDGTTILGTALVASNGIWSITPADANRLPEGTQTLTVKATDSLGNTSTATPVTVTIDTTAAGQPAVAFSEATSGGINATEASDGTPINLMLSAQGRAAGDIVSTVITRPDGSTFTVQTTLTPTDITNGTAVQSIDASKLTIDGVWTTTTTITDLAGNVGASTSSNFTLDKTAPNAPLATLDSSSDSNIVGDRVTSDTTPTITGSGATPGDTISVTFPAVGGNAAEVCAAIVASDGSWSVTPTQALSEGLNNVLVTATDPAGNVSAQTTLPLSIDTVAPNQTAVVTAITDNVGSMTGIVSSGSSTDDASLVVSGTLSATIGMSTVRIYDGATYLGDATVSGASWTFVDTRTLANAQTVSYTAKVMDVAGNLGNAGSAYTATIDTAAPTNLSADVAASSDTSGTLANVAVGNDSDNVTSDTTPAFTGTGEAGNVITLTLANGTYKTTVQSNGIWIIDTGNITGGAFVSGNSNTYATFNSGSALNLALPNNGANVDNAKTFSVGITATDAAGNTASVAVPITIDTIVTDPTINITNGISPITGTGEAGAKVVLYQSVVLASNDLNSATAGDTLVITGPVSGVYSFSYTLSSALAANHVLTTSKPRDVLITSQPSSGQTGVVSGTISASAYDALKASGQSIILYDSIQTGSVATVDSSGNWSVAFGSALASGTVLTANSVDLAGNIDPPGVAIVQTDSTIPLIKPTNGSVITGTGNAGDWIKVTYALVDGTSVSLGPVQVASNGTWSVTPGASAVPPDGTVITASDIGTSSTSTAAGVSSNATVDAVAPTAPLADVASSSDTGSSNNDNITSDTTPTLTGSDANPGDTITIKNGAAIIGTALVSSDGTWSITPSSVMSAGTYSLSVTATDAAGNVSQPTALPLTIDTTAALIPAAPNLVDASDTGSSNTDNNTSKNAPTFNGTGTAGDTITIYDGATVLGTAVVDSTGNWAFAAPVLADGVHSITTTATDLAGNLSTAHSAALLVTIDTSAPNAPVADVAASSDTGVNTDNITSDTTPTITGSGTNGDIIKLYDAAGNLLGTATVIGGSWSITPSNPLAEGTQNLQVTATDSAGNVSAPSAVPVTIDTTAPVAPVLNSVTDDISGGVYNNTLRNGGITNDPRPTLAGTAEPGSTVTIYDNGTSIGAAVVDALGNWTFTPTNDLVTGAHSFTIKATDVAGNLGTATATFDITVDKTAPTPTGSLTVSENTNGGVNATEVLTDGGVLVAVSLISSGAAAGDVITLTVDDPTSNTPITISYTITSADVGANSASVLIPTASIPVNGTYNLSATITDLAGNTSGVLSGSFLVDKTAPSAGTAGLATTSDTLNSTAQDNRTNDNTPVLSGTAEAGAIVSVVINGKTYTINPTASPQPTGVTYNTGTGAWTIDLQTAKATDNTVSPVLSDGTYTPVITVTDPAGNSTTSNGTEFVVDTLAPNVPTIATVYDNISGGVTNANLANGATTNDTTPTLSGTADAGSIVAIYDGAGVTPIATVTADVSGNWTYTPSSALASGAHSFTVKATDIVGNTSSASSAFAVTVDTAVATPTFALASDTGSGGTDGVTSNGLINVSGLESGATWQYSLDNGATWQTGSGNSFVLSVGSYAPGAIQIKQTDAAGNVSGVTSSAAAMVIDASISTPTISSIADNVSAITGSIAAGGKTNYTTPTLAGTAEANSTVSIYDGGALLSTATADGSGNWTYTPSALSEGSHSFTAKATDVAGNVSMATAVSVINIDTTAPTITSTGPADGGMGSPTDNLTITFSEAVVKGAGTIRLVNDTDSGAYIDIPVTDSSITINGNTVTIDPSSNLLMGKSYHVEITAGAFTDVAGNAYAGITSGDATTWNFQVPDPAISLNTIAGDNIVNSAERGAIVTLDGVLTSTAGAAVVGQFVAADIAITLTPQGGGTTISIRASSYNSTTGAWSYSVPAGTLVDGKTYAVSVQATHGSYSISTAGQVVVDATIAAPTFALAADTGSSSSDGITNNGVVNVSALEAGATWQYSLDNGATWQTGSGSRFVLPAGTYTTGSIKVKQTDIAGNISTTTSSTAVITVDLAVVTPAGGLRHDATNDTGTSTTDNLTKLTTPTLSGSAEANANISVVVNGATYTTTADSAGAWSVTVTTALGSGNYTPVITTTDKAGNSTTVNGAAFTVDTNTPNSVTCGLDVSSDSGTKGDNRTNDTTPTLTGTAEPGVTVKVTVNGTIYTTTADPNGVWSFTTNTLSNGVTYTPSIVLVDQAGNTSSAINGTAFTIDTVAPTTGTAALSAISDTGTTGDNKTNDATPVLAGTAESGATVDVTIGSNIYTTIAGSDGKWTLDLGAAIPTAATNGGSVPTAPVALANGAYTPSIKVTDVAGNTSGQITSTSYMTAFTVDVTPPVVTLTAATLTSASGNAVVKSTETGTIYLVKDSVTVNTLADITGADGSLWNSVSVSANTNTNLATTGLVDGSYKAYAVDAAGNLSLVSSTALLMDSKLPTVTGIAITSSTGALNNRLNVGDVVYVTMTTSEAIATANGTPMVLLNIGGTQATSAGNPVGGTAVWADFVPSSLGTNNLVFSYTITANQKDANGISIYPSVNNWLYGNYYDAAGNLLNKSTAYLAVPDNISYMVDTTVATPVLALAADTGISSTDRVTSNNVINVTGLEIGATWEYSTDNGVTWSAGSGASFNVSAASYIANYVQVRQTDLAGNTAIGKYAYAFTVDSAGPTVTSIAITSATGLLNSTLNAGDVVTLTVNMSEATTIVTTGGIPQLALNVGGQNVYASYSSGTGSTALVFKYTIDNDLTDINGISIDANSLTTNGGTLKDAAGNNAVLTHNSVTDNVGYKVDTTAPTVFVTRSGSGMIGTTELVTLTLSEPSTDFIVSDVTVTNGSLSAFTAIAGSNNKVFTAIFTPTANSVGTATIGVVASKFTDAAGNANLDTSLISSVDYEADNQVSIAYDTKYVTTTVAFSSMTKDTSVVATANTNADWTTADGSAGRLLSGSLSAALTAGQTVKVYRDNILIGDAVVADGGKAWEITDPNGYSANWIYTAKVVGPTGVSGTVASRAVILDTIEAAPVITAVRNANNEVLPDGSATTAALASVKGTGVVGNTIYLYDNTGTNLVGTTTVASDGTWIITGLATNSAIHSTSNSFAALQVDGRGNQSVLSNLWRVTAAGTNQIVNGDFATDAATATVAGVGFTVGTGVTFQANIDFNSYGTNAAITTWMPAAAVTTNNSTGTTSNTNISWFKTYSSGGNPDGAMSGNTLAINVTGGTTGILWQNSDISVEAGKTYLFKFDYSANFNGGGNIGLDIDGVTIAVNSLSSESGHYTVKYVATATKNITLNLWGNNTYTANTSYYGDIAVDNLTFFELATPSGNTLVAGNPVLATAGDDNLNYAAGLLSTLAGNDTINAVNTSLQTTLASGAYINAGAGVDMLKLSTGTTLDLTAVTSNQTVKPIQEVEIFEMQGDSSRLVLSANDVLSLGGANASTMSAYAFAFSSGGAASTNSTGKVQLVVLGQAGDILDLKELGTDGVTTNSVLGNTGLAGTWLYMGTTSISSTTYKVYNHSTTDAQVLVDPDVAVNTKFIGFSSMTKDTAFGVDTSNANWTTADLSAGRLVSGTLDIPLASDEVVKLYSTVSGVETLIGTAVINAAGTAWEMTDLNAYTGSWVYTARVMSGSNTVSVRTQTVTVDTAEVAPVITAISNGVNITSGAGDQVGATISTSAVSSISGTGIAGDLVYVYDNSVSKLVGMATVASNGTWSLTALNRNTTGTHQFMAVQMDQGGNISPFSNSHTVTLDVNLVPSANGSFVSGATGFANGFTLNNTPNGIYGDANAIWNKTTSMYDVDNTFVVDALTTGATNLSASGAATVTNNASTIIGNQPGTAGTLTWATDYGNIFTTKYDNPDSAMSGNVLMANITSSSGWGRIWQNSIDVVAGWTYVLSFDYTQNGALPIVFFGDTYAQFNTSAYEYGHLIATFTATTTGTIQYGIAVHGSGWSGEQSGGDIAVDNIKLIANAYPNDGSLVTGNIPTLFAGVNDVTYSSGILATGGGNDVITASATTLQTTLTTGGGSINGGAGLDTLKLAANTTLDLSAAAVTLNQTVKSIQEVEIFTLQGNTTLTLSANDVLSLGLADAFATNGKVQFMVNATSTDTVTLKGLLTDGVTTNTLLGNTSLTGAWSKVDRLSYNNVTYDIYDHSTTGAQVWLQTTAKIVPTISITRSGTTASMVGAETITFTLSNASADFVQSDVTVSGGVLSNWTKVGLDGDGRQIYTATFTPTANSLGAASISVASNKFSVGGLFNADGTDADNTVAATFDTKLPTVAITQKSLTATTSLLTFALNRTDITDFVQGDVSLNTGSLSDWAHVGVNAAGKDIYTALYTYSATGNKLVAIGNGAFTDSVGRANADGADANNKLDFTEAVSSMGAVIYNGVGTAYSPLRLNPTTVISAGQMVTNLKMSLDYYATAGDGISFAFGSGGYRYGLAEYGLVNGIGATIDTLSGGFGGNWVQLYDNNYTGAYNVQKLAVTTVGSHHADFDVSATGLATLTIDGVALITRQISNWTTASQAGWYFQVQGRTGSDGGYFSVSNLTMSYNKIATGSPLALDLNGDGVQTLATEQGVDFDLQASGTAQHVGWVDCQDGILVLDLNNDGLINTGAELFGDHTVLPNGSKAADGWQALAQYDVNLDNIIDQNDAVFAQLKVWVDANTNGKTDSNELKSMHDLGIVSINLSADNNAINQNGNNLRGFSSYTTDDGSQHQIVDAWLVVNQLTQLEEQQKSATPILSV